MGSIFCSKSAQDDSDIVPKDVNDKHAMLMRTTELVISGYYRNIAKNTAATDSIPPTVIISLICEFLIIPDFKYVDHPPLSGTLRDGHKHNEERTAEVIDQIKSDIEYGRLPAIKASKQYTFYTHSNATNMLKGEHEQITIAVSDLSKIITLRIGLGKYAKNQYNPEQCGFGLHYSFRHHVNDIAFKEVESNWNKVKTITITMDAIINTADYTIHNFGTYHPVNNNCYTFVCSFLRELEAISQHQIPTTQKVMATAACVTQSLVFTSAVVGVLIMPR